MPRVRQFSDEEWEEIEEGESRRVAADVIRWACFDHEGTDPVLREQAREVADKQLRLRGLL
jgi:hypothetical protein